MTATRPDQPTSADDAVADLEDADTRRALTALQTYDAGDEAGWRPAADGDTPGQCEPEHGPVQPIDLEPHHAAARQRTDEERAAVRARTCCGDAAEGPDEDGVILHTLGCRNRCAVDVPCLGSGGRPSTYPCGTTRGHADGDHWVQPAARPKMATGGVIPAEVADEMLARLEAGGCAYPPPGRGLDLLVERYGADAILRISGPTR